jgi:hypothetical protein
VPHPISPVHPHPTPKPPHYSPPTGHVDNPPTTRPLRINDRRPILTERRPLVLPPTPERNNENNRPTRDPERQSGRH